MDIKGFFQGLFCVALIMGFAIAIMLPFGVLLPKTEDCSYFKDGIIKNASIIEDFAEYLELQGTNNGTLTIIIADFMGYLMITEYNDSELFSTGDSFEYYHILDKD